MRPLSSVGLAVSKVILITGCRSGIGLALAKAAGQAGYTVYAGLRDITTKAELVRETKGFSVHPVQLDVTKPEERDAIVNKIAETHGRLDVLINNAAIGIGGFLEEMTESEMRWVLEVNVIGAWALTKACIPSLRDAKGSVLMISSLSGQMGVPGLGSYCMSKFALEGLSEAWRHELAVFDINLTLIQPGAYKTAMTGPHRKFTADAGTAHPQYNRLNQALIKWYDKTAVERAYPPSHLAERVMKILQHPNPKVRYAIGPSTGWRRIILKWLPFSVVEWYFRRVLSRPLEEER